MQAVFTVKSYKEFLQILYNLIAVGLLTIFLNKTTFVNIRSQSLPLRGLVASYTVNILLLKNDLNNKLQDLPRDTPAPPPPPPPPPPQEIDENYFVTWPALEDALRGIRQELQPIPQTVIEAASQTETVSKLSELLKGHLQGRILGSLCDYCYICGCT